MTITIAAIVLAGLLSGFVFNWPVVIVASSAFAFIAGSQWFFGAFGIADAMIWFALAVVGFQASFLASASFRQSRN